MPLPEAWERHGGSFLHVGLQGQKGSTSTPFVEDLEQTLLSSAPAHSLAVVHPDRIVMHEGPQTRADELVRDCLRLLQP